MNFDYLIYFLAGVGITSAIYQYLKFRNLKKGESSCICFKQVKEKIFSVVYCKCGNFHICEGIVKSEGEGDLEILDTFEKKEDAIKYFNELK